MNVYASGATSNRAVYGRGMALVDDLLANPGLYVGADRLAGTDHTGVARIVVTPLPGRSGVTLDYEVVSAATPENGRSHVEHTIIARTHGGGTVMVIGHPHAESVAILRETDPGVFEVGDEPAPFPMKVVVSMPEPGRIRHSWWYGRPGDVAVERDVSDVVLQS
ncbi:MAG: hypothetical protein JWN29_3958 [Acidimicrobiales bacterium]|nr:hypothetical protein [Acidimicrobiales bacterium]